MRLLSKLGLAAASITLVAVGTALPADAITVTQAKAAQTRLNKLGCAAGPVDGKIGTMTKAATVRFQSANRAQPERFSERYDVHPADGQDGQTL